MPTSRSDQTKRIAQRIDITHLRRPSWFRLWRRWVVVFTVVVVGTVVAVAAVANLMHGRGGRLLNPGPVNEAHANFENDCSACHDHGGKGGFSRAVSDTACLKCHREASAHGKGVGARFVSSDAAHSKNCISCHTEHQSHPALVGMDNRLCSECHASLNDHVLKGRSLEAGFDSHIKAFAVGAHPGFGRSLKAAGISLQPTTQKSSPWLPDLHLHFNHAVHMNSAVVKPAQTCAGCHVPVRSDPRSVMSMGSMQPVNYERNCRSCHNLEVKSGGLAIRLPHEPLEIAMAPLLNAPGLIREQIVSNRKRLDAMTNDDDKTSAADLAAAHKKMSDELAKDLEKWAKAKYAQDDKSQDMLDKLISDSQALEAAVKPKEDPIVASVKDATDSMISGFGTSVSTAYDNDAKRMKKEMKIKEGDDRADQLDALGDQAAKDWTVMAEYLAANKATTSCSKCHEMAGQPVMEFWLMSQWKTLKGPSAVPVAPERLHTVSTGVGTIPKVWFAASRFDHEAHRDMDCVRCHVGMEADEDNAFVRLPSMESCVECHHEDSTRMRGAGASCIECHEYHPR